MSDDRADDSDMSLRRMVKYVLDDDSMDSSLELEAVYGRCKTTSRDCAAPSRRSTEPSQRLRTAADQVAMARRRKRSSANLQNVGYALECSFDDIRKLRRWLRLRLLGARDIFMARSLVGKLTVRRQLCVGRPQCGGTRRRRA